MHLSPVHHLILDADGVLWKEHEAMPGLIEFVAMMRRKQIGFVLASNNSRYKAPHYVEKFKKFGVEVQEREILNSGDAVAQYLEGLQQKVRAYVIGEEGLRDNIESTGAEIINDQWHGKWNNPPTHVVVGFTQNFTYADAPPAVSAIRDHGAQLIATNKDTTFLHSSDASWPANGMVVAGIEYSAKTKAIVIGKPEPLLFQMAMERMGAKPETTAIIGDMLETDMTAGQRAGIQKWLVLSGVTTAEEAQKHPELADRTFPDIREVTNFLESDQR